MEEQFERLAEDLAADPDVKRAKMMGHPAVKTGGKMFAMAFGEDIVVKLGAGRVQELADAGAAKGFEPMAGRQMGGWAQVPPSTLERWAELADEAKAFVIASLG